MGKKIFISDIHMGDRGRVPLHFAATQNIYANSGAWCYDAKCCTFVETEIDQGKHFVRLNKGVKQPGGNYEAAPFRPDLWIPSA